MAVFGSRVMVGERIADWVVIMIVLLYEVVPGAAFLTFAARLTAPSSGCAATSTTISVFGWYVALAGLDSPLFCCSLAVFPFFRVREVLSIGSLNAAIALLQSGIVKVRSNDAFNAIAI